MNKPGQKELTHRLPREWHKITIAAPVHRADIITSFLASISVNGIEQTAPPTGEQAPPTEKINTYLSYDQDFNQKMQDILDFIKQLNTQLPDHEQITYQAEPIKEQDWNIKWKQHFKPFKLTNHIIIKPSWEPYTPNEGELIIEMDPGMAFGTGLHASTKLALTLIEKFFFHNSTAATVLDVGTGTGILAMSCALFGATQIVAIDNDIDARTAARQNIAQNNFQNITVSDNPLNQIPKQYSLVIANITCDILTTLADDLVKRIRPGGNLVLSGILANEQEISIKKTFSSLGLKVSETLQQDEWVGIHFQL